MLTRDQYGNLSYDDDFTTTRWQHFGGFKTGHASHAGFRDAGFWVGLKGGYPVSNTIVQRFSSPHPLKELKVSVDGYANSTDLGGQLILKVAPRDGKPLWSTGSKGRHKGRLTLRIPTEELTGASAKLRDGLQHFDVRVTLRSTSGVENGPKACATFDAIHVRAR